MAYHVNVREEINVFDKFAFESEFQRNLLAVVFPMRKFQI